MASSQVDHFLPGSDSDKEEKRADSLGTVVRVGRVEAASTEDTPNFNTTNSTLRLSGSTELRTHAVKIGRKRKLSEPRDGLALYAVRMASSKVDHLSPRSDGDEGEEQSR